MTTILLTPDKQIKGHVNRTLPPVHVKIQVLTDNGWLDVFREEFINRYAHYVDFYLVVEGKVCKDKTVSLKRDNIRWRYP